MKFNAIEQSLRKPQPRKIPKIALLVALAVVLSVLSIYSPLVRVNTRNISKSPPKFDFVEEASVKLTTTTQLEPCHDLDGSSRLCHGRENEEESQNVAKRDEEAQPSFHQEESEPTKSSGSEAQEVTQTNEENSQKPKEDEAGASEEEAQKVTKRDENEPLSHEEEVSETTKSSEPEAREAIQKDKVNTEKPEETLGSLEKESCDLFTGEWVPNPGGPYYTNSCYGIQEHQNCMKYGRPDSDFMKWRWQPDGCELPIFDPQQFLELVRGKAIAFVGDSVARNHVQSLMCLLSRVMYPREISNSTDENKEWEYKEYNFKMSILWAPYLVRSVEITAPNDKVRSFSLYLDEFHESWPNKIKDYDYVIISAGHWFPRPTMFYENGSLVGCQYCSQDGVPRLTSNFSYQRAFRTAFRAINSVNYRGVTFVRTFAPSHFENGTWDKGGNCPRTRPFKRNETVLTGYAQEFYKIQLEELRIAEEEGRKKGSKFRLFDATKTMLLRPDGHPSKYGHWPSQNVELPNDCVHWCLPGPIDTWNDFLLELLRREETQKKSVT